MWYYVKTLEYPVNLKCSDLNMAKLLITQYGGPDGELGAALRYLNQRYTMPTNKDVYKRQSFNSFIYFYSH